MKSNKRVKELMTALANGYRLCKEHHGDSSHIEEVFIEYYEDDRVQDAGLRTHGWASALGKPVDRITDILQHPENWYIGESNDECRAKISQVAQRR